MQSVAGLIRIVARSLNCENFCLSFVTSSKENIYVLILVASDIFTILAACKTSNFGILYLRALQHPR